MFSWSRRMSSCSCRWMYWRSGYEISTGPEMLPYEVALPFTVYPSQMAGALALDVSDHLRHGVLWGIEIIICA
jgi:hypothetical protein